MVLHTACPADNNTDEQPAIATPFEANPTVPVGDVGPEGVTVAVKVTDSPRVEGFMLGTSTVELGASWVGESW